MKDETMKDETLKNDNKKMTLKEQITKNYDGSLSKNRTGIIVMLLLTLVPVIFGLYIFLFNPPFLMD